MLQSIESVQHWLDLKFGAHSLARLKIAVFMSNLDLHQVKQHRVRLLTRLLQEEWLACRVAMFEQELLEHSGRSLHYDENNNDEDDELDSSRLMQQLHSEEYRTDWKRIVQFLYLYPTFPKIPAACLQLLQCSLKNTGHKRAVVHAGGVAALVACLDRLTSLHNHHHNYASSLSSSPQKKKAMSRQSSSSSTTASSARSAVTLLIRLLFTQGTAGYFDRLGTATGTSKDEQTLHLSIVELLSQSGAWNAIAQATTSNVFQIQYSGEEGYEHELARQNIETTCRCLQQDCPLPTTSSSSSSVSSLSVSSSPQVRLSNQLLQKRVGFLCTCLASLLDDPSIGEPLGSILKQH